MKYILCICFFLFNLFYSPAQDIEYAREIINQLSSPEMEGRGYSGKGNRMAANYIADEFNKSGLKSFGKNYYQDFKIEVNTFPFEMFLKIDEKELVPGEDYIADPASGSLSGKFPVVLLQKSELLNIDLRKIIPSLVGKVLIIDERNCVIEDKDLSVKTNELVNFLKYNPGVLAEAVIILTDKKLTWGSSVVQASRPVFVVNSDTDLSSVKNIEIKIRAKLSRYKTCNVTGYVEGTQHPDSFLVIIAHYDHLGMMGSQTFFPGANDNASGVAMLLNLARYFSQNPVAYSMVFIALSAEEIGIEGAKYFTENPLFPLDHIRFLVNFDLAGTGEDGIKVVNGSVHKREFEILSNLNSKNSYLKTVSPRGPACNSDHCPFDAKGVACFYIYTLGGISAYHDIYDVSKTLPLTEFNDYSSLMRLFFNSL